MNTIDMDGWMDGWMDGDVGTWGHGDATLLWYSCIHKHGCCHIRSANRTNVHNIDVAKVGKVWQARVLGGLCICLKPRSLWTVSKEYGGI